jgi:hypothetical protein
MRQFDFLGTWDDSWLMIEALLRLDGYHLIYDLNYAAPHYQILTELNEESKQLLQQRGRLYIMANTFSESPPVFSRIQNADGATWYSISIQEGGPFLSLTLPACYDESGRTNLANGSLSFQKQTLDPTSGKWIPPSDILTHEFKKIVRMLKSRFLVRHRIHTSVWIGANALDEVLIRGARIHGYEIV